MQTFYLQSTQQILSFDANFGLKRKKSSGKSLGEPFHKGHFFIDQAEVDNFLATQRCYQKKGEGVRALKVGADW